MFLHKILEIAEHLLKFRVGVIKAVAKTDGADDVRHGVVDLEVRIEGSIPLGFETLDEVSNLLVDLVLQALLADPETAEGTEAEAPVFFRSITTFEEETSC